MPARRLMDEAIEAVRSNRDAIIAATTLRPEASSDATIAATTWWPGASSANRISTRNQHHSLIKLCRIGICDKI
jgi:hypothetical protein